MHYRLRRSIALATSLTKAWEFFSDPRNLSVITPPDLKMQIISELDGKMYPGQIIAYNVHPILGIPLRWVTEITQVKEPHFFVDEQRYGPYRMWHHQHFLHEVAGGVVAEDIVDYIMPFGPLGKLLHILIVAKQLETIFSFRNKVLSEKFGLISTDS